ncbi:YadA family autotransporter adhesin [Sphingomonas sp. LY160]|uniref:YadA family autotransporter adhesin n=1 Tax=Sphingomonas sp. LY160 TaxID=3095342 RepID=UPI002ADED277|nr:YadA-like family protein [Sphingomonas sp. LY160]MEA1072770.1 YadA-like family protein [Sphingomonas sp. LY160]
MTTLLANAAAGQPITLQTIASDGTLVGPSSQCDAAADSFTLDNPAGIAIGGNRITGLGATGQEAVAGEIDSIALGNRASTAATALGSIAIGPDAVVGAGAVGSIAFGDGANATAANSVALGAGSTATRANTVSVGAPGAERIITNVAAGTQGTDAVNLSQLNAVAAAIPANAVEYDDATRTVITLDGAGGTRITNVLAGAVTPTSTDAVNGSQLNAVQTQVDGIQTQVTGNTTAITNLQTQVGGNTTAITNLTVQVDATNTAITDLSIAIANGAIGPVQYSNPGTPTVPNGGVPTNDVTLVGAAPGPVGLHNVANGVIAAGSTDAVNGGQIYGLALTAVNAVQYQTDAGGNRTNTVVLQGGNAAAPVTITGLAPGALSATSTDAVNGSQLFATNQAVVTAQGTANTALALGQNSVQYDNAARTSVTLAPGGTGPVTLRNVAAGTANTDGVNVGQLNAATGNAVNIANAYTDSRIEALDFDLRGARRDARAGSAAALAAAGMPQAMDAGRTMVAGGVGTYRGRSAMAIGASHRTANGQSIFKVGLTYDSSEKVGANAGVGFQF